MGGQREGNNRERMQGIPVGQASFSRVDLVLTGAPAERTPCQQQGNSSKKDEGGPERRAG